MATDALPPCLAKWSAIMILNVHDKQVLVFYKIGFQLPEPVQCWEILEDAPVSKVEYHES